MGTKFNVACRPPTSGAGKREYADVHDLQVSKQDDAGEKITFAAYDHSFVVVIPRADSLFNTSKKTLHERITLTTPYVTDTIKVDVEVGNYEYHVYCEEERDWAHKHGSSPPRIVVVP